MATRKFRKNIRRRSRVNRRKKGGGPKRKLERELSQVKKAKINADKAIQNWHAAQSSSSKEKEEEARNAADVAIINLDRAKEAEEFEELAYLSHPSDDLKHTPLPKRNQSKSSPPEHDIEAKQPVNNVREKEAKDEEDLAQLVSNVNVTKGGKKKRRTRRRKSRGRK